MSVISLSAKLDRSDSSTPWGFRLAGGKDFNAPLTVQKVVQGSLAERCGIQSGDVITSISGRDTQHFRHSDAQSAIQQAHNSLDLKLQRGGGGSVAPSYAPMIQTSGLQDTTTTFKAGPVQHYKPVQCGNASPRPFGTSGASTVTSNVSTYKTTTRTTMDSVTGQTQDMNLGETTSQPGTDRNGPGDGLHGADTGQHGSDAPHATATNHLTTPTTVNIPGYRRVTPPCPVRLDTTTKQNAQNGNEALVATVPKLSSQEKDNSSQASVLPRQILGQSEQEKPNIPTTKVSTPPKQSARYEEHTEGAEIRYKGYTNPDAQSKTFKALQHKLDSEQEIPAAFAKQTETETDTEKPKAGFTRQIQHAQYNSPMGLYSQENLDTVYDDETDSQGATWKPPAAPTTKPGPKVFKLHESETYRLLKEQGEGKDTPVRVQHYGAPQPQTHSTHTETRMTYQAPRSAPFRPSAPAGGQSQTTHTVQVQRWQPQVPSGPRTPRFVRRGEVRTSTGMHAGRIPICNLCSMEIRGPFVLALDTTWCPDHFVCSNPTCRTSLVETGFVEEGGNLYCEKDYAQYFAPACAKCRGKIIGDCVNALHKTFHPHCFVCVHCRQPIGRGSFHMEDGNPYCEKDWQALYQTKCYGCQFPIEPGDRWVEALSQNWHSECFNCSTCQVNLEGQPFFAKGGRPYCKRHSGNY